LHFLIKKGLNSPFFVTDGQNMCKKTMIQVYILHFKITLNGKNDAKNGMFFT